MGWAGERTPSSNSSSTTTPRLLRAVTVPTFSCGTLAGVYSCAEHISTNAGHYRAMHAWKGEVSGAARLAINLDCNSCPGFERHGPCQSALREAPRRQVSGSNLASTCARCYILENMSPLFHAIHACQRQNLP